MTIPLYSLSKKQSGKRNSVVRRTPWKLLKELQDSIQQQEILYQDDLENLDQINWLIELLAQRYKLKKHESAVAGTMVQHP